VVLRIDRVAATGGKGLFAIPSTAMLTTIFLGAVSVMMRFITPRLRGGAFPHV